MIKWYKMTQNQLVDEMEDLTQVGKFGCNDISEYLCIRLGSPFLGSTWLYQMIQSSRSECHFTSYTLQILPFVVVCFDWATLSLHFSVPHDPMFSCLIPAAVLAPATKGHKFFTNRRVNGHRGLAIKKKTHSRPIHQPAWSPTQWIITLVTTVAL